MYRFFETVKLTTLDPVAGTPCSALIVKGYVPGSEGALNVITAIPLEFVTPLPTILLFNIA